MNTLISVILLFVSAAHADFGEIDLLVRESIQHEFDDIGLSVDLRCLEYHGEPKRMGRELIIQSSVWAEQRQIAPYWGWYECTTTIQVKEPGVYRDKGSECWFEVE